ncbi:MAG: hypothetical protein QM598_05695 [Protaetiibacter sp.]
MKPSWIYRPLAVVVAVFLLQPGEAAAVAELLGSVSLTPVLYFVAQLVLLVEAVSLVVTLALQVHRAHAKYGPRAPTGAVAVAAKAEERTPEGFPDARRARHEAAHAVVALALGLQNVRANIAIRGIVGGQVDYDRDLASATPVADQAFERMIINFAGQIVDVDAGHADWGAVADMGAVVEAAFLVVSTGARPERLQGEVTIDSLARQASEAAACILEVHRAAVDRIQSALVEHRVLADAQLRALMTTEPDWPCSSCGSGEHNTTQHGTGFSAEQHEWAVGLRAEEQRGSTS